MSEELPATEAKPGPHKRYHHGNLAEAIRDAVAAQIGEVGPEGASLRAAARAVGVSPAAAFRHYKDKRAVMTAIAVEGFEDMAQHVAAEQAAAGGDPAARFHAVGAAYVSYALTHPERFRVMFRADLLDEADTALREAGDALTESLTEGLRPLAGEIDEPTFRTRALLAWSAAHGLATLAIEGALDDRIPPEAREDVLRRIVWGMLPVFTAPADGPPDVL